MSGVATNSSIDSKTCYICYNVSTNYFFTHAHRLGRRCAQWSGRRLRRCSHCSCTRLFTWPEPTPSTRHFFVYSFFTSAAIGCIELLENRECQLALWFSHCKYFCARCIYRIKTHLTYARSMGQITIWCFFSVCFH